MKTLRLFSQPARSSKWEFHIKWTSTACAPLTLTLTLTLVAQEVVGCKRFTELGFFLPAVQIVAHSMQVAKRFTICRSILFAVKTLGLLEQKERISVRSASWRRGRANVVGNKRLAGGQGIVRTCFKARLDPVEDRTKNAKRRERSVEIKGNDEVGCRRVGNSI